MGFESCSIDGSPLEIGSLEWEETTHELRYRNQAVSLTKTELALLSVLVSQAERLVSREALRDCVWRSKEINLRTIDAHVVNLRKKLRRFEPISVSTPVIATVWGLGYKLKIAVRNKRKSIPTIRTSKR